MPTTFYLKYRPQNFSELDSSQAREQLEKIFKSGKIPHAFLFTGPKGIGKTSAARIVAKAVNCEKVSRVSQVPRVSQGEKEYAPCNECAACVSITAGANVDVLEIDAASNRGIDDIKELREKIKLAPASLKYKVYIIDEVHMLTTEAFNALLKTLEEPPKHAIFVLCTTDPEKLPKTITSRCQVISFKKASKKEIVSKLKRICAEEKLEYQDKALEEIAGMSDGSFRDANKILEQVSFSGKITEEEVQKIAGISGEFKPEDFLILLANKQTKEALVWIGKAVEQQVSLKILLERLLDLLRVLLLRKFGVEEDEMVEEIEFSEEELKQLIAVFSHAYSELKFAVIPQLPVEIAVMEWGGEERKLEDGSGKLDNEAGSEKKGKSENQKIPPHPPASGPASHFSPRTSNFSIEEVLQKWSEILEKVKPLNHSVQAFLKATRPKALEDGFLILEVFYKFHKDQLEKEQCRKIFEKAAGEVLGREIKLKCNLSDGPKPLRPDPPPPEIPKGNSQNTSDIDIMKIAEEIFNNGGTMQ